MNRNHFCWRPLSQIWQVTEKILNSMILFFVAFEFLLWVALLGMNGMSRSKNRSSRAQEDVPQSSGPTTKRLKQPPSCTGRLNLTGLKYVNALCSVCFEYRLMTYWVWFKVWIICSNNLNLWPVLGTLWGNNWLKTILTKGCHRDGGHWLRVNRIGVMTSPTS